MAKAAEGCALWPTRVQFQDKDPRGWQEVAINSPRIRGK
jgi:hypothetical protein